MSYQTEQQLEDGFIKRLVKNGYERILIKDTDALADNFRKKMNRMNAEGLKGQELSVKEFEVVLASNTPDMFWALLQKTPHVVS